MPQAGMQPAGASGWTAPQPAKSSGGGRTAAIVLAIVGGGALLLTLTVLGLVWVLRSDGGADPLIGPRDAWQADPQQAAKLQPEVGVGRFAVRPPPGYQLTRTESKSKNGVSTARWYWQAALPGDDRSRFQVTIKQHPRYREFEAPQVITSSGSADPNNETYVVPGAEVTYGSINGMPATRIAQPLGGLCMYVAYDDDTVVAIETVTPPGDASAAALLEAASRTLRKGGGNVPVAKVGPPVSPTPPGGGNGGNNNPSPERPELEPGMVAVAEPYSKDRDAWAVPALDGEFKPHVGVKLPESNAVVRFPATPSACVMLGSETWDYRAGTRLGRVNRPRIQQHDLPAVSPDGKLLVLKDNDAGLQMWSFETGELLHTAANPGEGRPNLEWSGFRSPTEAILVVGSWGGRSGDVVMSWTAGSDQPQQLFTVDSFATDQYALSDDGALFAYSERSAVRVADLTQPNKPARYFDAVADPKSSARLQAFCFSPDARQLAGYTTDETGVKLFVWDVASGKVESSHQVLLDMSRINVFANRGVSRLRWLPDDAGFLLAGRTILDRRSGRPLWQLRAQQDRCFTGRLFSRDHLLVTVRQNSDRYLTTVPIPWKRIGAATRSATSSEQALVKPNNSVGLEVHIQDVRYGDPAQTQRRLARLVQQRLKLEGIDLHKGGDVRLYVKYKERKGDVREIVEKEGWRERRTGQTVIATLGEMEIGWKRNGQTEPLWHDTLRAAPATTYYTEIDEFVVRESMFRGMQSRLLRAAIPYFLSQDGKQMLPLVSDLPGNFKGFEQAETAPPADGPALALATLPPLPGVEEALEGIIGDPFAARRAQLELEPWVRPALAKNEEPKLWLPLREHGDVVVYSRTPGPFVAVGRELWNLESGELVGSLDLGPDIRNLRDDQQPALSPDGKLLALWESHDSDTVSVWSWETGRKIREFKARKGDARLIWSGFRDPHELVLVWRSWDGSNNNAIQVWNAATGDPIHALGAPRFEDQEFALSPTGERLAFVVRDGLWVADLTTESKKPKKYRGPKDASSAYSWINGLGFAPDGRQIVAYARSGGNARVLVWKGSTSFTDRRYPEKLFPTFGSSPSRVLWLPDSSGYLLGNRALIDHESGRVLWVLNLPSRFSRQPLAFLDQEHLLVPEPGGTFQARLVTVKIPWESIQVGLRALTRKSPAYVTQGAVVGFDVELLAADEGVGGAPFDPGGFPSDPGFGEQSAAAQLRSRLGKAVTDRLKVDGVRLGPGAPVEFFVLYGEQMDEPEEQAPDPVIDAPEPGGMGPFGPGGFGPFGPGGFGPGGFGRGTPTDNGPKIKTILQIGYRLPRAKQPLWAETIITTRRDSSGGDGDEGTAITRSVEAALYDVMIPYFIPKNSDLPILPIVSQL